MSSESSRSWTTSPNLRWSSIMSSSRSSSRPARPSMQLRHRSTRRRAAGGGAWPVRRSRTIIATASSIGASARSVISSNLPRWNLSSSIAGEVLGDALHAARADRLDARLLDRLEHRARLLAARHQAAMHGGVVTGHPQRDRVGMAAHDRGVRRGQLARRLGQPRLAAHHARPLGGERDLELGLPRDGAQAAGHRALERLGRRFLGRGLGLDVGGHHNALVIQTRSWPAGNSVNRPNSR